jgi:protein-L-isoaspartate(D-aspartate) O-methyltransferase
MSSEEFKREKERLIEIYVREGILKTKSVIEAFRRVPRENFVPEHLKEYAYADTPLPIGYGQTISAPHF